MWMGVGTTSSVALWQVYFHQDLNEVYLLIQLIYVIYVTVVK